MSGVDKEQKIILASLLKILSSKIAGMLHKQMTEYISLTAQLHCKSLATEHRFFAPWWSWAIN